jgi:hypothetical protein
VLFSNEHEITLLFETDDVEDALVQAEAHCGLVAVTLGAKGAVVSVEGRRVEVPAESVERVVDTTGAGDLFAAGFLFGLSRGSRPRRAVASAHLRRPRVISHVGARPETSLARDRLQGARLTVVDRLLVVATVRLGWQEGELQVTQPDERRRNPATDALELLVEGAAVGQGLSSSGIVPS